MGLIEDDFAAIWRARFGDQPIGHAHFWERALSRRTFMGAAALATGAALTPELSLPVWADGSQSPPNPIMGGTQLPPGLFHFYFPTHNNPAGATHVIEDGSGDPSLIRDFKGVIGVGEWAGGAIEGSSKVWGSDIRFMKGTYVGTDGEEHRAAFTFI